MDIHDALPPSISITIPKPGQELEEVLGRWSDAHVTLPHAILTPSKISDIRPIIAFGKHHGLTILPASGGHGSFVPITSQTLYVDMRKFKSIDLDEEKGEVRIGGGCLAGEVLKDLAGRGWCTTLPNSNPVGVVGAFLGGLSHSLNGVMGFGIDSVRAISIIPFSRPESRGEDDGAGGEEEDVVLSLTPESQGEGGKLFRALCGAGHGLGIVTSVTLQAWRISSFNMVDDKIWTRRLIFPYSAISIAAELYTSLLPPPPELTPVLAFLRAPPTAPVPGAPMVMLAMSYFGPVADAERVCARSFEERFVSAANVAVTVPTAFENMNDGVEALNAHGGFKEYHGCFCKSIDVGSIEAAFEAWKAFTEGNGKERGRTFVVIGSWSTARLLKNGFEQEESGGGRRFFDARDRGVFVQATPWYADQNDKEEADSFGRNVVGAMRRRDESVGLEKRTFVNNLIAGQDMRKVYSEEILRDIERIRRVWDRDAVGWNPLLGWYTLDRV